MSEGKDVEEQEMAGGVGAKREFASLTAMRSFAEHRAAILLCLFAFLILIVLPFRIHMYDFAAQDDARRHVAKVVSDRDWSDIVVLDEPFTKFDHNHGWHVILGVFHKLGLDKDQLLTFSSIGLFLLFALTGLVIYRREPDAWMVAMLASSLLTYCPRWLQARPFVLAAAFFIILLHLWRQPDERQRAKIVISTVLFALAAWIHGSWYLFVLMPLGLLCCGRFRDTAVVTACWLGGSFLGACLTGRPVGFLMDHVIQAVAVMNSSPVTRLLVPEFQPSLNIFWVFVVLPVLIWKHLRGEDFWKTDGRNPAFWLMIIGWILGFKNGRFWMDWGSVAFLVWLAWSLGPDLRQLGRNKPFQRMLLGGLIACGVYLSWSADEDSRWSNNEFIDALSLDDPAHEGWLPDPGGILYSDKMIIFYLTFYENPDGPWRYILGYEAGLMPPEDLKILREIQFYQGNVNYLYKPWIDKFTPADRLVLVRDPGQKPDIPALEWKYAAFKTWVGRLPRSEAPDRAESAAPGP